MSLFLFETFSDNFQSKHNEVTSGKWFGLNSLNLEGKPFATFFEGSLVLKLGAETIAEIISRYPGAKLFDPSGNNKAMKDWLQIPAEFEQDWLNLAEDALVFAEKSLNDSATTPVKKKAAPKKAAKKKVVAKKKSPAKKKAAKKKSSAKKAKMKPKAKAKKKVVRKKTAAKKRKR
ncbi:hypothetical protein [Leptospira noguchii]|uniref:DUF773 domain-containing protein n=3 Tax=Leptospira noguchii TaxID=28182 RepID=M6U4L1_9LEPT|nr:hypothetical protein [Leptospira noguchii]EMO28103.1 hypothetical protein LEP1GSC170_3445 [Leptospira interrogans serovar Bataviae str. HAI135]EKR73298.1 hypothetical protein LEP1GSC041_1497 [Leptospira noguchii str. 2006001870]EMI71631.1 hypothetical protein LEP1GSC072_3639 [Leptospira noguchii str. Bonito]EMN00080.1 hypothetical protein LEP1GSC035_3654 [Leptospira noguchii str. 2007001578]EMO39962.1 hypothetical protein LEP1GSC186_1331 [Leptospira noguchii serovar Autumnalis str. ZUN142]